jgi:hypothetical protein
VILRVAASLILIGAAFGADLELATFQADVTPPIGAPLCNGAVAPAERIVDPLSARGIVLLGGGKPLVLVSVDWVGIGNEGQTYWREALAEAANTTAERVRVHTVHQHDAPGFDLTSERILEKRGLSGAQFDLVFGKEAVDRVAEALGKAIREPRRVTHLGLGSARVEKVASNRRVLGEDGNVKYVRYSKCKDPVARAQLVGVIDPLLRSVSLWNGDRPLVELTYYATHPQSYYGFGGVSADFVGMARGMREAALPEVFHVHFNGASGNVAAGKYNDGSKELRPVLARRLADGMKEAWEATVKTPIRAADVDLKVVPVALPLSPWLEDKEHWLSILDNPEKPVRERIGAASNIAWRGRVKAGKKIDLAALRLGPAYLLLMPGELFVEFQLAAQQIKPTSFVAMAAYGDYGPGYIGTRISYSQGGYEPGASRTAPEVESVMMEGIRQLFE